MLDSIKCDDVPTLKKIETGADNIIEDPREQSDDGNIKSLHQIQIQEGEGNSINNPEEQSLIDKLVDISVQHEALVSDSKERIDSESHKSNNKISDLDLNELIRNNIQKKGANDILSQTSHKASKHLQYAFVE